MMKKVMVMAMAGLLLVTGILSGCGDGQSDQTDQSDQTPVVSENISWPISDTTVYATITRPESGNNLPAVVFVPGSGPTDRDWNSPLLPGKNGSAKLLAEELAKRGYITIRYDKRFAGVHAAENLPKMTGKISMQSHLEELQGAIDILAKRDDVDSSRIFALANSEGTIHTINYQLQAKENKLAGMILTGAPGQSMGDLARTQIAAQLNGVPDKDQIMALYDEAIVGFMADGTMNPDASLPAGIKSFLQSLANPVNMPFTREIWTINIADDLPNIDVPVLIIIGKKDIQVNWQVDGANLQAAAQEKENIEFAFPENANHVLKYEAKPKNEIDPASPNYNGDDTVLDPDTLNIIAQWLAANAK